MKIYIAGPITGCDGYEKKFAEAERVLKEQGHIIINPAMLPEGLGDCDTYMGICFAMIDVCDAVVMLDGWKKSFGSCREWGYAFGTDKLVCEYTYFLKQEKGTDAHVFENNILQR